MSLTPLDGPMGTLARTLTGLFGRTATYVRMMEGTWDPATLDDNSGVLTLHEVSVVPAEGRDLIRAGLEPGTLTEQGKKAYLLADVLGFVPSTTDRMRVDGREWAIDQVLPVFSGQKDAAFILVLESA